MYYLIQQVLPTIQVPVLLMIWLLLVCHEIVHARLFDLDEECVDEIGRLVAEICAWVARQNDGVIG